MLSRTITSDIWKLWKAEVKQICTGWRQRDKPHKETRPSV